MVMIKNTREKKMLFFFEGREFYFSHACCRRIFFDFFLERDKKEKDRIFFKTALHSFLFIFFSYH